MSDIETLRLIAAGQAFPAEVENDLEERGLVRQTDQPYAQLTAAGRRLIAPRDLLTAVLDAVRDEALVELTLKTGETTHGTAVKFASGNGGTLTLEDADGDTFEVAFRDVAAVEVIDV